MTNAMNPRGTVTAKIRRRLPLFFLFRRVLLFFVSCLPFPLPLSFLTCGLELRVGLTSGDNEKGGALEVFFRRRAFVLLALDRVGVSGVEVGNFAIVIEGVGAESACVAVVVDVIPGDGDELPVEVDSLNSVAIGEDPLPACVPSACMSFPFVPFS